MIGGGGNGLGRYYNLGYSKILRYYTTQVKRHVLVMIIMLALSYRKEIREKAYYFVM